MSPGVGSVVHTGCLPCSNSTVTHIQADRQQVCSGQHLQVGYANYSATVPAFGAMIITSGRMVVTRCWTRRSAHGACHAASPQYLISTLIRQQVRSGQQLQVPGYAYYSVASSIWSNDYRIRHGCHQLLDPSFTHGACHAAIPQ